MVPTDFVSSSPRSPVLDLLALFAPRAAAALWLAAHADLLQFSSLLQSVVVVRLPLGAQVLREVGPLPLLRDHADGPC